MKVLVCLSSLLLMGVSCTSAGSAPFIQTVDAKFEDSRAKLSFEFNKDLALNLEVTKSIAQYGFVQFVPASGSSGFKIVADLSTGVFLDKIFTGGIVTTLPNGSPFPSFVNSRLGAIEFVKNPKWSGSLYVGVDPGKRLLGTSVNLSFIDASFPAGLNISQKIKASSGADIGSVTFFGPMLDSNGAVVKPGGIFVIVNLNDLLGAGLNQNFELGHAVEPLNVPILVDGELEIYDPNSGTGNALSPAELQALYEKVLTKAREAGVIQ